MSDKFVSNAKWTKIKHSKDTHDSEENAKAVCEILLYEYGLHTEGCETRGHCLRTWVTREDKVIKCSKGDVVDGIFTAPKDGTYSIGDTTKEKNDGE